MLVDFPVRKVRISKRKLKAFDDENQQVTYSIKKRIPTKVNSEDISSQSDGEKPSSKTLALSCYQETKKALHSSLPIRLLGRENESAEILNFLQDCLKNRQSNSLYISGAPGTGKTASLIRLFETEVIKHSFKYVYINCMSFKQSTTVYQKIVRELDYKYSDISQKTIVNFLEKKIVDSDNMIVLVLDEIDQLDSKNQEVLYTLFGWPNLSNSKLILIGIANALDLTDRVLPRLQAYGCKPKLLHFRPYTYKQILSILEDRLRDVKSSTEIFKPAALLLCARKIAASSGDVRKALDVCRRAIEIVEIESGRHVLKVSSDDGCNLGSPRKCLSSFVNSVKQVDICHIGSVLDEIYTSKNLSNCTSKENSNIPLQQKLILCTLLLLIKETKLKEVTLGKLYSIYLQICKKRQIYSLDQIECCSTCSLLESQGFINIRKCKDVRSFKISLKINEDNLETVMCDRTLMASVLNDYSVLKRKT